MHSRDLRTELLVSSQEKPCLSSMCLSPTLLSENYVLLFTQAKDLGVILYFLFFHILLPILQLILWAWPPKNIQNPIMSYHSHHSNVSLSERPFLAFLPKINLSPSLPLSISLPPLPRLLLSCLFVCLFFLSHSIHLYLTCFISIYLFAPVFSHHRIIEWRLQETRAFSVLFISVSPGLSF